MFLPILPFHFHSFQWLRILQDIFNHLCSPRLSWHGNVAQHTLPHFVLFQSFCLCSLFFFVCQPNFSLFQQWIPALALSICPAHRSSTRTCVHRDFTAASQHHASHTRVSSALCPNSKLRSVNAIFLLRSVALSHGTHTPRGSSQLIHSSIRRCTASTSGSLRVIFLFCTTPPQRIRS